MTTDIPQQSATIIQFPLGGRRLASVRDDAKPATAARMPAIAVGGSWYHEAAIQDSKRVRERP